MRVSDFSGQILINITTKSMEKLLELLGYKGIEQWHQFRSPNEHKNYIFRSIMIEIERYRDEWECTDVTDVDWTDYGEYLLEKEAKTLKSKK
ncbi:unnamed protein product [Caenorhabditis sp. 36 PRJEB53466]|nr:unnamed protein product [Caenorhabditis sp. 36 PRJEB53466]